MRHRRRNKYFQRRSGPRKALIRGLLNSLVEHGRIRTTVAKAKELQRHVEKAITLGRKATLASRRVLIGRYNNVDTVEKLVTDLGKVFKSQEGGYTRIMKIGRRPGDSAEMAFIEFTNYKKPEEKAAAKEAKSAVQAAFEANRALAETKRKHIRKLQGAARRTLRANSR